MGNTTNRALPYPEGSGLVIQGDDAIQALAEAVDATFGPAEVAAAFAPAESSQVVPTGGDHVKWTGTASLNGFTYDAGTGILSYAGPTRAFMISTAVVIQNGGSPATSSVELRVNHAPIMSSYDNADSAIRNATHALTAPVFLANGDFITVAAFATPAGDLDSNALRVFPIGGTL